jgi:hypothetical protein
MFVVKARSDYLWSAFDSPFLFIHNHSAAWQGAGLSRKFISALLLTGFFPLRFGQEAINIFLFLAIFNADPSLSEMVAFIALSVFVGVLMLPYLTIIGGPLKFTAMTRYILLAFPVFIVIARPSPANV